MKQVRHGVFETNSSSTHSICIAKKAVINLPSSITFRLDEYGWENDSVNTGDYLYTAIVCCDDRRFEERMEKLKAVLANHHIIYNFIAIQWSKSENYRYAENASIDHTEDLNEFLDDILNDESKLLRFLFGNSTVYTGNDNSSDEYSLCNSADETIWDDNKKELIKNPNHDSENYEYFSKGN